MKVNFVINICPNCQSVASLFPETGWHDSLWCTHQLGRGDLNKNTDTPCDCIMEWKGLKKLKIFCLKRSVINIVIQQLVM